MELLKRIVLLAHCLGGLFFGQLVGYSGLAGPEGPDGGKAIARERVARILKSNPKFLDGLGIDDLEIMDPHRAYAIGLKDLVGGNMLSAATFTSWRYLLQTEDEAVGEVRLRVEGEREGLRVPVLNKGPLAAATRRALQVAEALPQVQENHYEVRFLQVSAVHFAALWLHSESGDIIIPMRGPREVNLYEAYSENEMIAGLRSAASSSNQQKGQGSILDSAEKPTVFPFER